MSDKIIHLGQAGRQGIRDTLVTIKDLATGEILDQGSNSILFSGSINAAMKDFCFYNDMYNTADYSGGNKYLNATGIAIPPNYDISLLGKTKFDDGTPNNPSAEGVVCLFAVGIDGVENAVQSSLRKEVKYEGYMSPSDMCAFRVRPEDDDLTDAEKEKYAAVKNINGTNFYYFKKFETMPTIYTQREKSGDSIEVATGLTGSASAMKYYEEKLIQYQESSQVIVQMNCKVTPQEIREWFEYKGQSSMCNISSIMICTAVPILDKDGNFVGYKNIMPKSKRHITRELLLDAEKGLEIIYQYLY